MILAIDIGNTTVALGGIRDGRVCFVAHVDTIRGGTAADYRPRLGKAFSGAKRQPVRFEGAILSSVVPELTQVLADCAAAYCPAPPIIVSPQIRTGLTMQVPEPDKVGRDRIVDAAAAEAEVVPVMGLAGAPARDEPRAGVPRLHTKAQPVSALRRAGKPAHP